MSVIVVTGGRNYHPSIEMAAWLRARIAGFGILRQGGAGGVDMWARHLGASIPWVTVEQWDAEWTKHGPKAGPLRNRAMLEGPPKADLVIAFPGNRGTADCIRAARKLGIEVEFAPIYTTEPPGGDKESER